MRKKSKTKNIQATKAVFITQDVNEDPDLKKFKS